MNQVVEDIVSISSQSLRRGQESSLTKYESVIQKISNPLVPSSLFKEVILFCLVVFAVTNQYLFKVRSFSSSSLHYFVQESLLTVGMII